MPTSTLPGRSSEEHALPEPSTLQGRQRRFSFGYCAVRDLLHETLETALAIIATRRTELERVATALLERETLTGKVLLPARNRRDFEDIPESTRAQLDIVWIDNVEQVVGEAMGSDLQSASVDRQATTPHHGTASG